jgi:hypothetical protein
MLILPAAMFASSTPTIVTVRSSSASVAYVTVAPKNTVSRRVCAAGSTTSACASRRARKRSRRSISRSRRLPSL